jgi:hypothetical protein
VAQSPASRVRPFDPVSLKLEAFGSPAPTAEIIASRSLRIKSTGWESSCFPNFLDQEGCPTKDSDNFTSVLCAAGIHSNWRTGALQRLNRRWNSIRERYLRARIVNARSRRRAMLK